MNVRELGKCVDELIRIGSEQQILEIQRDFRNASDMKMAALTLDKCIESLNRTLAKPEGTSSTEGKTEVERNSQGNNNIHYLLLNRQSIAIQQVEQIVDNANLHREERNRDAPLALVAATVPVNNAAQNETRLTADLIAQSFGNIGAGILEIQRLLSKHEYPMDSVE